MNEREALRLALEALELTARDYREQRHAIAAIREALALPVATRDTSQERVDETAKQRHEQEPVATLWQHGETGRTRITVPDDITDCDARWFKAADLYTTPPSNSVNSIKSSNTLDAQRKPLTDVTIWNTYKNLWMFHPAEEPRLAGDVLKFARAIEAAHGIKE